MPWCGSSQEEDTDCYTLNQEMGKKMTERNIDIICSRYKREFVARNLGLLVFAVLIAGIVIGCRTCSQPQPSSKSVLTGNTSVCPAIRPGSDLSGEHPPVSKMPVHPAGQGQMDQSTHKQRLTGTVVETISASRYTYVLVEDDAGVKHWAAAPLFEVKVGDKVIIPTDMQMKDFFSKTLNRKFDYVYFAGGIRKVGDVEQ